MKLYKTKSGIIIHHNLNFYRTTTDWDILVNEDNLYHYLLGRIQTYIPISNDEARLLLDSELLAPVGQQEVWAAGVTYFRSREARKEESKSAGDFYEAVYIADRPELFFKGTNHRIVGSGGMVKIRRDSIWDVPEPELTLFINSKEVIQGYSIGNDMSSRSIEAENPLYLPQAKTYDQCAGLGPCLYVPEFPIEKDSLISLEIIRNEKTAFLDSISISQMKRSHEELVEFLFRECTFPMGCYLMTGTGIVPPDEFTLKIGDEIRISIDRIGILVNFVC